MIQQLPNTPPEIEAPLELETIHRGAARGHVLQSELLKQLHDIGARPSLVINSTIYWRSEDLNKAASIVFRRKLEKRDKKK